MKTIVGKPPEASEEVKTIVLDTFEGSGGVKTIVGKLPQPSEEVKTIVLEAFEASGG